MKLLMAVALVMVLAAGPASAAPVKRATFTTPYAHPMDPVYPIGYGTQQFRWGWFGAEHYPQAPVMHRDYTKGWREYHYRW